MDGGDSLCDLDLVKFLNSNWKIESDPFSEIISSPNINAAEVREQDSTKLAFHLQQSHKLIILADTVHNLVLEYISLL